MTSRYDLTAQLTRWRGWLADLLCPSWRVMLIIVASQLLNDAIFSAYPDQGAIQPFKAVESVFSSVLAFMALWLASRPARPAWLSRLWGALPPLVGWRGWRGIATMALVLTTWSSIYWQIAPALNGQYYNDAISFVHQDADVLLQGRNPYTADDAFWRAARRWPLSGATPILGSTDFGRDPLNYPTFTQFGILQHQAANPAARNDDFDTQTVHNYPAGIIWLALPLVWAGSPSIIPLNALCFAIMLALVLWRAPRGMRWPLGFALLLNPAFMIYVFVNIDAPALLFVLLAWHVMRHEKSSALCMGVACAMKQVAWFIAPFYLLEVARRDGWLAALRRAGWLVLAFLVPNLPFIIAAPEAWAHSMLIPMTDPLFPLGFGLVSLALGGIIPIGTAHLWTALTLAVMVGLLVYQWKRPPITADGIFLGLIPLWFSWRSPMNYFALIPVLVAWIASGYMQAQAAPQPASALPPRRAGAALSLPLATPLEPELAP